MAATATPARTAKHPHLKNEEAPVNAGAFLLGRSREPAYVWIIAVGNSQETDR